jgi:hypothetical protein
MSLEGGNAQLGNVRANSQVYTCKTYSSVSRQLIERIQGLAVDFAT